MATPATRAVPDGYHTLTPYITVKGAAEAIEFYKKAFGAEELFRMPGPDGRLMHAEFRIGDSIVMISDEFPEMGGACRSPATLNGTTVGLMIYSNDVDSLYDRAIKAGATAKQPPQDMFWGDRYGNLLDPSGHLWSIATHKEDLTPEEIAARAKAAFGG